MEKTYFRKIERKVFSLEESSGVFSGTTVADMVSSGAGRNREALYSEGNM
jgi:hypothetical protein